MKVKSYCLVGGSEASLPNQTMISPFMILVGWERGGAGLSQPTSNMKVEIVFVRLGAGKAHPNREQTLFLVFHVKEVGVVGGREASLPSFPHHNQLLCHEILMLGWGRRARTNQEHTPPQY